MRRLPIPLLVLMIVIAFPVAIPIAIVSWLRDRRRMRAVAKRTHCECCGATLGAASLRCADPEWAKRVAALQSARSIMRFRMIRSLWAICAARGAEYDAEYDYDFRIRIFRRVVRSDVPDDRDGVSGSPTASACLASRAPSKWIAWRRRQSRVLPIARDEADLPMPGRQASAPSLLQIVENFSRLDGGHVDGLRRKMQEGPQ
jgi:hypothetical protein